MDPLLGPCYGGTMQVITVIEHPAVIREILAHLGLPSIVLSLRAPPECLAVGQPREWLYEPGFDDLPLPDPVMA